MSNGEFSGEKRTKQAGNSLGSDARYLRIQARLKCPLCNFISIQERSLCILEQSSPTNIIMAVSFAANSIALANWGFSAGDIAAIAGAGRNIGTWVMAQIRDQNLLDFIKVDPDHLIPRKGIIDPTALHKRWDVALILLQNGGKRVVTNRGTPLVESMPKFSWFMTLVLSCLDASLQLADLRKVTTKFLMSLFAEHVDGVEYILRELPHHVQGWISAACVRNITAKARHEWFALAERRVRRHGYIPDDDCQEVGRLLIWLAGAGDQLHEKRFETASSDVYALATVLQAVGFDLLSTSNEPEGNESRLLVVYNPDLPVIGRPILLAGDLEKGRYGMRIPLDFVEECVSLWPGTLEENNFRRSLFKRGMDSAKHIQGTWFLKVEHSPYGLRDATSSRVGRVLDNTAYDIARRLFPLVNPDIVKEITRILKEHPKWAGEEAARDWNYLEKDHACLEQVQIFTLGYYYSLMASLLDTSQLSVREAYGQWKWNDVHLLYRIEGILATNSPSYRQSLEEVYFERVSILRLLGILFAGLEEDQCNAITDAVVGFHGKLTILAASLLGHADTLGEAMRFYLLDLDATAIPSNAKRMIVSGTPCHNVKISVAPKEDKLCEVQKINLAALDSDFTSHIEPDWDNDVQACHIVYRSGGRIIRRFAPRQIQDALYALQGPRNLDWVNDPRWNFVKRTSSSQPIEKVYVEDVQSLYYGKAPTAGFMSSYKSHILFPTQGHKKARTCLQVLYSHRGYMLARPKDSGSTLSWIDPLSEAVALYSGSEVQENSVSDGLLCGIVIA